MKTKKNAVAFTKAELEEVGDWMESLIEGELAPSAVCSTYREMVELGKGSEPLASGILKKIMLSLGKLDSPTRNYRDRIKRAEQMGGENIVPFAAAV